MPAARYVLFLGGTDFRTPLRLRIEGLSLLRNGTTNITFVPTPTELCISSLPPDDSAIC
jgi:hypothetical protein